MKNTFQVVMLPTEKVSPLLISKEINTKNQLIFAKNYDFDLFDHNKNFRHINKQHLYIISDDEIKKGDWVYDNYRKAILQAIDNANTVFFNMSLHRYEKIVATTDNSINVDYPIKEIPESFIQAYIKAYNEGKPITEVDLETEPTENYDDLSNIGIFKIKTRPDNTVIVHQSKLYTKDEVHNLMMQAWINGEANKDAHYSVRENWIQNNL